MKVLILQGSPRKNGNTKQLTEPFADELRKHGVEIQEEWQRRKIQYYMP